MSTLVGPKCAKCRREGMKLFLKGERCMTPKCAVVRKNYAPGSQGKTQMRKLTEYGKQLREKQKAKRAYGLREKQFSIYAQKAIKKTGIAGDHLINFLESRIDNILYKAGFASSRNQARQMSTHGLFKINDRKITVPSIQLKVGDKIMAREHAKKMKLFENITKQKYMPPKWLKVDPASLSIEVAASPTPEDFEKNISIHSIIEFYSK